MPQVPAICLTPNCNTLFPSGITLENARNTNFYNCTASPCPKCGGIGKIPDGRYDVLEDNIFAFLYQVNDIALFNKIAGTIERDIKRKISPKNIRKKLSKQFPKQNNAWNLIPETKQDAYAVIKIILAIIMAFIALGTCSKENREIIINNTYNNLYLHEHLEPQQNLPFDNHIENIPTQDNQLKI